jgi:hypothetical protein
MFQTVWSCVKPYAEWALKYWPFLAAGGGLLAWLGKILLKKSEQKMDKDVLKALPEDWQGQFMAGPVSGKIPTFVIENASSIAKKLGRKEESVVASLQRLKDKGLAQSRTGFWTRI